MSEPVSAQAIQAAAGPMLPNAHCAPTPFTQVGVRVGDVEMVARFELRARERERWWELESVKARQGGEWRVLEITR